MRLLLMAVFSLLTTVLIGQDSLRIMYYNLLNYPGTTAGRADTLRKIVQYAEPDLLVVNELSSEEGADYILSSSLNVLGKAHYLRAEFTDGEDTDNMLFYDSTKCTLLHQNEIETDLRLINEYELLTMSPGGDSVRFLVYSAHFKSSQGDEEEQQRYEEAMLFKAHLADKTHLENVIFGGDLNLYGSSEPAYTALRYSNDIELFDPIDSPGEWHNNSGFASIHTQSTRSTQFGGGATGGMDDRFDFILVTNDIMNGSRQMKYKPDSYHALGQDGLRFNESLIDPENHSLPDSVLTALYYMSDHLPVIMTLELADSFDFIQEDHRGDVFVHSGIIRFNKPHPAYRVNVFNSAGQLMEQTKVKKNENKYALSSYASNQVLFIEFEEIKSGKRFTIKSVPGQ